jgi:hypothetical protein
MLLFVNHYHYLPIITFLGGFKKEISLFCIILISLFSIKEFISGLSATHVTRQTTGACVGVFWKFIVDIYHETK